MSYLLHNEQSICCKKNPDRFLRHAIIEIGKMGGPYAPLTSETINAMKRIIRQARRTEKLAATSLQLSETADAEHVDEAKSSNTQSTKEKNTGNARDSNHSYQKLANVM